MSVQMTDDVTGDVHNSESPVQERAQEVRP